MAIRRVKRRTLAYLRPMSEAEVLTPVELARRLGGRRWARSVGIVSSGAACSRSPAQSSPQRRPSAPARALPYCRRRSGAALAIPPAAGPYPKLVEQFAALAGAA